MNAANQPWWVVPSMIAFAIVFYGGLGWLILIGIRRLRSSVDATQQRALGELKVHAGPGPGLVAVVFHTYHGLLVFVEQTEHRFWAPPEDAREALWRLHRLNLTRGMFAYGALLIPLLSYGNYLAQKRSIRKQEAALLA